jgi:putative glutamine amidotransferase
VTRKSSRPERAPLIGITPDEGTSSGEFGLPQYELKKSYAEAVASAGGLPLVLPYTADRASIEDYLALCDGLLITGGAFDVPPALYGEKAREGLGTLRPERSTFEATLVTEALARDIALLGICGGMQLLNVVCGGTLFQDLERELPGARSHEQQRSRREPSHEVTISAGTRLSDALGPGALMVNSTHHQAVRKLGDGLVTSAVAPDGVVEAIEASRPRFAVGVQWHPELLVKSVPINRGLYRAFVAAAAQQAEGRQVE